MDYIEFNWKIDRYLPPNKGVSIMKYRYFLVLYSLIIIINLLESLNSPSKNREN